MKKNGLFGLMVILLLINFIGCGEDDPEIFTVTIGTLANGQITANPTSGIAGTEITLTVNPNNLYQLKNGTLKYGLIVINETSKKFILPAENVTVTADFETLFEGTWKAISDPALATEFQFIFIENNFTIKRYGNNLEKGTFTFSEMDFQLNRIHQWRDGQWIEREEAIETIMNYNLQNITTLEIIQFGGSTSSAILGIYEKQ